MDPATPRPTRVPSVHDPDYMVIIRLLRAAREAAGFSQGDVARQMGYTRTVITKLEAGELRLDLLQLRQYCRAIGLPLVTFVEQVETALAKPE